MTPLRLMSRHWIVDGKGRIIIGEGRQEILENIRRTGSINRTARLMKMSYKAVWSKIKATEASLNARIVHTDRKEGTRLTAFGEDILARYALLKQHCLEADNGLFETIFALEPGGPARRQD